MHDAHPSYSQNYEDMANCQLNGTLIMPCLVGVSRTPTTTAQSLLTAYHYYVKMPKQIFGTGRCRVKYFRLRLFVIGLQVYPFRCSISSFRFNNPAGKHSKIRTNLLLWIIVVLEKLIFCYVFLLTDHVTATIYIFQLLPFNPIHQVKHLATYSKIVSRSADSVHKGFGYRGDSCKCVFFFCFRFIIVWVIIVFCLFSAISSYTRTCTLCPFTLWYSLFQVAQYFGWKSGHMQCQLVLVFSGI